MVIWFEIPIDVNPSLYKTRGQVFFNKRGLMWTLKPSGARLALVGSTQEEHGNTWKTSP